MEQNLSDESISQICMNMRVIDLLKSNMDLVNESPEMKEHFGKLCALVNQMMDLLTDEQRDIVLEEHKRQLELIRDTPQGE